MDIDITNITEDQKQAIIGKLLDGKGTDFWKIVIQYLQKRVDECEEKILTPITDDRGEEYIERTLEQFRVARKTYMELLELPDKLIAELRMGQEKIEPDPYE